MRHDGPIRRRFQHDLAALEGDTLGGLELVSDQLRRTTDAVVNRDAELAELVIAEDRIIDGRHRHVHDRVVAILACQAPVARDLRLLVALLETTCETARMGNQCVGIAKLVALDAGQSPCDAQITQDLEEMGFLALGEVEQARHAFADRDVRSAAALAIRNEAMSRLNRRVFRQASDAGADSARREWAMRMILAARALERVGDHAVSVADRGIYLVTGHMPQRDRFPLPAGAMP